MADDTKQPNLEQELEQKIADIQSQEKEDQSKDLAKSLGLPYLNLARTIINPAAVSVLDEEAARKGHILVISKNIKDLNVAVSDPNNPETKAILEKLKTGGYNCSLYIVSEVSLDVGWQKYKIERKAHKSELGAVSISEADISRLQSEVKNVVDLKNKLKNLSTTDLVNMLVAGALKIDASDIHLEPEQDAVRLRYRIDGVLQDIMDLPKADYLQALSRIKLLSGLKINIHDISQDGRFTIRQEDTDIELRTSILPGAYGENIVMRLLDPRRIRQKIEELGMREDTLEAVRNLLKKTTGAIITTGPTGSGKTTSLYAFINQVNSTDIKIITIEDPIEYHVQGISQTQVDPESGYDFANGLRSIVRQDPDVILVGEIRDAETADIAIQAALTGHLVFTTLHTNDAAGAIPRLINFGISPVTIAPAVNATMAQRLVRRLCEKCKKMQKISSEDFEVINKYLSNISLGIKVPKIDSGMEIYYPQKCAQCNEMGYKDRIGVYEMFAMDPEMEKLIITSPSITEIKNLAIKKGMITMLQDGLIKVLEGKTSVEEVLRVIGE